MHTKFRNNNIAVMQNETKKRKKLVETHAAENTKQIKKQVELQKTHELEIKKLNEKYNELQKIYSLQVQKENEHVELQKSHSLEIEKQEKKYNDLLDMHSLQMEMLNEQINDLRQNIEVNSRKENCLDETKIIIKLLAKCNFLDRCNETDDLKEFSEKYELVKKELGKLECGKNMINEQNITKKIAVYLAKLKTQNENISDELELCKSQKERMESKAKTLKDQLENVVQVTQEEEEKKRRKMELDLKKVEADLQVERKQLSETKIINKKLDYKVQDIVRNLIDIKVDFESKQMLLSEAEISKNKLESKLLDVTSELNNVKLDLEKTKKQLQDFEGYLDVERSKHVATEEKMNAFESLLKDAERKFENEKKLQKINQVKKAVEGSINYVKQIGNLEEQLEVAKNEKLELKNTNRILENEIKELKTNLEMEIAKCQEKTGERKKLEPRRKCEFKKQETTTTYKKLKLVHISKLTASFCEIDEEDASSPILIT